MFLCFLLRTSRNVVPRRVRYLRVPLCGFSISETLRASSLKRTRAQKEAAPETVDLSNHVTSESREEESTVKMQFIIIPVDKYSTSKRTLFSRLFIHTLQTSLPLSQSYSKLSKKCLGTYFTLIFSIAVEYFIHRYLVNSLSFVQSIVQFFQF